MRIAEINGMKLLTLDKARIETLKRQKELAGDALVAERD